MLALVLVSLFARPETCQVYQEAPRLVTWAKGWYLGSQVGRGMTSQQVLAILGIPTKGGKIFTFQCVEVGGKGFWLYPDYGIVVNWYTEKEIWWAVPQSCPGRGAWTPETARVSGVEFYNPISTNRQFFLY